MARACAAIAAGSATLIASHVARAANQTWTGGSPNDGNWSDTLNWTNSAAPGSTSTTTSTDVATFNAAIANTWGASAGNPVVIDQPTQDIGGISFDTAAGNYFIGSSGGNALLLTSGGTIQILSTLTATNAIETINAPLTIEGAAGTYTFANNSANGTGAGAGTLVFGGPVSGGAVGATVLTLSGTNTNANTITNISNGGSTSLGVTKLGAGTWELSGANTYSGSTLVSAGTLQFLGTSAVSTSSAVLQYFSTTVDFLSNTSGTFSPTTFYQTGGGTISYNIAAGDLPGGSATGNTLVVANVGQSGGQFGSAGTTPTFNIAIANADTLQLGSGSSGTGAVSFYNNTTLNVTGTGSTLSMPGGMAVDYPAAYSVTLTGGGNFSFGPLAQDGTFLLTVNDNSASVLRLTGSSTAQLNLENGATLDLNGNNVSLDFLNNSAALTGGIVDNISAGGTASLTVGGGTGGANATTNTYTAADTFSGVIQNTTGTVSLIKVSPTVLGDEAIGIMATASLPNGGDLLALTNKSTYGGNTTVDGGMLELLFGDANNGGSAVTSNILPSTTNLVLAGGDLMGTEVGGGTATQTVASTILNAGASHIGVYRISGNQIQINLGTITRNLGSTLDFQDRPSASNSSNGHIGAADGTDETISADANFTGGSQSILGGWATYNGTTWATSAGTGSAEGVVGALGTFSATYTAGTNVDSAIGTSTPGAMTINSLRFNNAGAYTINTGGNVVVATGGILETNNVGANAVAINNNSLTSGNGQDLIIIQNNISGGNMTIGSNITDNSGSIGLTKSGLGNLTLTPNTANTFTGQLTINSGIVSLGNANALNSNGSTYNNVVFGGTSQETSANAFNYVNGTLALNGFSATVGSLTSSALSSGVGLVENLSSTPATLTINSSTSALFAGNLIDGSGGGSLSLVKSGSSTETLTGSNVYTGSTTVNGGTLVLPLTINSSPNVAIGGGATLTLNSGSLSRTSGQTLSTTAAASTTATLNGATVTVNGGTLNSGAANSTFTMPALTFTAGTAGFNITDPTATSGSSGLINVTNSNGLTLTAGNVTLTGGTFNSGTSYNITYDLFQYAGTLGGAATNLGVATASMVNGLSYLFGTSGGYVTLNVSGTPFTTAGWITDGNGSWASSANWSGGTVPNSIAATANFAGAASTHGNLTRKVTLDGTETVGVVTFASPNGESYTIDQGSGGNLVFNNGSFGSAQITVSSGNHTIDSTVPVNLSSNLGVSVASSSKLTIAGVISNTSTAETLSTSGAGMLTLSNANTYGPAAAGTVGTNIGGGTVQVGNNASLGAGDVAFAGSATLQAGTAGLSLANNIQIGNGFTATIDTAGNTFSLSGTISNVSGSGALAVASSTTGGTLIVTGPNTYSGGTTVNAGATLQIGNNGTAGSLPSTGAVADAGSLVFERTDAATITVANTITGIGSVTENGGSANTLELTVSNNYSGGTAVSSGTLQLGNVSAISTGDVSIASGALLDLNGFSPSLGVLNGSGNVTSSTTSGTLTLTLGGTGHTGTLNGYLNNANGSVINLSFNGSGGQTLGNATYTGTTVVENGSLTINGNSAIGSSGTPAGEMDVSGINGNVNMTVSGNAAVYTSGTLYLASDDATAGGGQANGNPGASTLTVGGNAIVSAAALSIGKGSRVGTGTAVTVQGNGTLSVAGTFNFLSNEGGTASSNTVNLNGGTLAVGSFIESGGGTTAGNSNFSLQLNGGVLKALASDNGSTPYFLPVLTQSTGSLTVDVDSGGAIINPNGNDITISAALVHGTGSPDGGLTEVGTGTLSLLGANTYTGQTNINNGTLAISSVAAVGSAQSLGESGNVTLGVASTSSGILDYTGGTGALNQNVTALGNGGDTIENTGTGLLSLGGTLAKNGTTLTLVGGTNGITVSGNITGANANSDLIVNGGTTTLTGNNTYNGPTDIVNGATLNANAAGSLPSNTPVNIDVTGSGTSTLSLGINQSAASLSGPSTTSTVFLASNAGLTLTGSGNTTYAGLITDSGSTGRLTMSGSGTQILTGANTYHGGTTINSGTLRGNGASAFGSGSVAINGGNIAVGDGVTTNAQTLTTAGGELWNAGGGYAPRIFATTGNNFSPPAGDNDADDLTTGAITLNATDQAPFIVTATGTAGSLSGTTSYQWQVATISSISLYTDNGGTLPTSPGQTEVVATQGQSGTTQFALNVPSTLFSGNSEPGTSVLELIGAAGGTYDLDIAYSYSSAPEPGTAMLVLAGGLPMLMARRRRKNASVAK
jgi:autotransporter-associated beta strand protein